MFGLLLPLESLRVLLRKCPENPQIYEICIFCTTRMFLSPKTFEIYFAPTNIYRELRSNYIRYTCTNALKASYNCP
jgi:hypothetical protein